MKAITTKYIGPTNFRESRVKVSDGAGSSAAVMNIELLKQVRDHIKAHPEQFDMDVYYHPCASVACIAGWAVVFSGGEYRYSAAGVLYKEDQQLTWSDEGARVLGLTIQDATRIFFNYNIRTAEKAVAYLDKVIETGIVPQF